MSSTPYPNAPAALVAFEIRFPQADGDRRQIQAIASSLHDTLPIAKIEHIQQFQFPVGPNPEATSIEVTRFQTRDRTSSASVWPDRVVVETTKYPGYSSFRKLIEEVVSAVASSVAPSGIERVGLRFVDEVRPPVEPTGLEWRRWVAPELIGPASLNFQGGAPEAWQGAVQFSVANGVGVALRYGPRDGYAVNPEGALRRATTAPYTSCFVFDSDSFWVATDSIPEFEPVAIMNLCDELHRPLREVFEQLVTDELRIYMAGEAK